MKPIRAGLACALVLIWIALLPATIAAQAPRTSYKFAFGSEIVKPGYIQVSPNTAYSMELGYGFDLGSKVSCMDGGGDAALPHAFCTSDKPFFFSISLPEGNYTVTVTLGDPTGESATTIKAELRRLMLENVHTVRGKFETRTFTINIRTPKIAGGGEVNSSAYLRLRRQD